MTDMDLFEVGILEDRARADLLSATSRLPCRLPVPASQARAVFSSLQPWLAYLRLEMYEQVFRRHDYDQMEKVRRGIMLSHRQQNVLDFIRRRSRTNSA